MLYLNGEKAKQFHTENTAIALGKFDGIHLGHQMLVEGLQKEQMLVRKALIFTFSTAPNEIMTGCVKKTIYTAKEKAYYFDALGMDILLEHPFDKEFASIAPEDFVYHYLVKRLGVHAVYVGSDFHFGKGRSGNIALLQSLGEQYHFKVHVMTKKSLHGKVVSSTLIRDLLETHFSQVNGMLGNPYFIYGEVVHGNHLGRTIGFPTINQLIPEDKLIPAFGVYASRVEIDGIYYRGISNLGKKPTIAGHHQVGLETYLFDYSGDLYGRSLKTELLSFVRPEERFPSVDALKKQIENDIAYMMQEL